MGGIVPLNEHLNYYKHICKAEPVKLLIHTIIIRSRLIYTGLFLLSTPGVIASCCSTDLCVSSLQPETKSSQTTYICSSGLAGSILLSFKSQSLVFRDEYYVHRAIISFICNPVLRHYARWQYCALNNKELSPRLFSLYDEFE